MEIDIYMYKSIRVYLSCKSMKDFDIYVGMFDKTNGIREDLAILSI